MPKHDLSSHHFQRKISDFCEVRIAPIVSKPVLANIRSYLISLIAYRKAPPLLNGRIYWTTIAQTSGLENELTAELKKQLRLVLDAIIRWLGAPPTAEDIRPLKRKARSSETHQQQPATSTPSVRKSAQTGNNDTRPLYRAVIRLGETFDDKTLLSWIQGERVPRSVASFGILARIEQRYRLPPGYFKAKLPHQSRALYGHDLGDISPAERRRIAVHLPDDFASLPFVKREEILDWVRRVIISGATDYRRYQAAAVKQRYAIRFPGVTYGGRSPITPSARPDGQRQS